MSAKKTDKQVFTETELTAEAVAAGDHKIVKKSGALGGSTVECSCGWESVDAPSTAKAVAQWTEHATE